MDKELTNADLAGAVYGVLAWLTTRDTQVTFGASCHAGPAAEAAKEFCEAHGLGAPRDDWDGTVGETH